MKILILHGPNLNLLGTREPHTYGTLTLAEIDRHLGVVASQREASVTTLQSNSESALIDAIHDARNWAAGIVFNPGAFTHYSYALHDAIRAVKIPVVEIHVSNIHAREEWRQRSVISPAAIGVISGFGWRGYLYALQALLDRVQDSGREPQDPSRQDRSS
jgi:3-dehydroquinate dehydratase II